MPHDRPVPPRGQNKAPFTYQMGLTHQICAANKCRLCSVIYRYVGQRARIQTSLLNSYAAQGKNLIKRTEGVPAPIIVRDTTPVQRGLSSFRQGALLSWDSFMGDMWLGLKKLTGIIDVQPY